MTLRRRMTVPSIFLAGLLAASLTCVAAPAGAASDPTLVVTQLPAQVRLVPGEQIDLSLSTNRTTGYSWSAKVTGDTAAVRVGAGTYVAPPTTGMVGVPGTTTWRITARQPGRAVVRIIATPPGGGTGTVERLTVIVMRAQ